MRKWRYLWLSVPYLNFDMNTIGSNPQEIWSHEKFKDFVNWVLLSQNGSISIQQFRLYCLSYADNYTVYRWVCAVARRNVQALDLTIFGEETVLPHWLVTCETLEVLKLDFSRQIRMCVLKLPSSVGFSRLKSLDLNGVELLDHTLFHKFISSRPFLEKLILKSCSFRDFKILDISSTSLKSLTLDDFGGDESGNYKVKIACPNLVSFIFLASGSPDFAFEDLDSLQNAFIFLDIIDRDERDNESCHILSKILNGLCEVKVLKLSTDFLEFPLVLEERACFATSFNNLKSLILSVSMAECIVPSLINLLNCSPNLEALTIYFEGDECHYWKIPNKAILCLTCHLKTVELIYVRGHGNELELMRFLLKNGRVLQKMNITWAEDFENPREIIPRIMKFPRSSSSVALKFLEPNPENVFSRY